MDDIPSLRHRGAFLTLLACRTRNGSMAAFWRVTWQMFDCPASTMLLYQGTLAMGSPFAVLSQLVAFL